MINWSYPCATIQECQSVASRTYYFPWAVNLPAFALWGTESRLGETGKVKISVSGPTGLPAHSIGERAPVNLQQKLSLEPPRTTPGLHSLLSSRANSGRRWSKSETCNKRKKSFMGGNFAVSLRKFFEGVYEGWKILKKHFEIECKYWSWLRNVT